MILIIIKIDDNIKIVVWIAHTNSTHTNKKIKINIDNVYITKDNRMNISCHN